MLENTRSGSRNDSGHNRSQGSNRNNNDRGRNANSEPMPVTTKAERAKVKWYDKDKGYGFVVTDSGDDLFIHASTIQRNNIQTLSQEEVLIVHRGPGRDNKKECVAKAYYPGDSEDKAN